ncbi:MAG: hypothetical protein COA97_05450 [Flavobacteriales bacterium]|nr:MAG: hypothetical protein COA97_05450 [Flavobacteriales bacterium]
MLVLVVTFFSCSKDSDDYVTPDIGHDYAGLEVGKYVIYDVDSFFYNNFNDSIDTSYYQIKEVVDSKYEDLEGEEAFKIIRYRKEIDSTNWVLIDVWNSKITQTNFQKVEENVRFVKLIFPVKDNKNWNGNSMNTGQEMIYEYTSVDNSEIVGSTSLNNVLTVLQLDNINLVEEYYHEEKYAKGIGMVYKKNVDISKKEFDSTTGNWERTLGTDITMTLSSYGG